jgi:hypothetical protein
MKCLPYVYICTHKVTKQFYIGVRLANKVSSELDLGIIYKTSSKIVKPIFEEFDYKVYAEFFEEDYAWEFEQKFIGLNKNNPLMLNISHYKNGSLKFHTFGRKRTEAEKLSMSKRLTGVSHPHGRTRPIVERFENKFICSHCGKEFSTWYSVTDKKFFVKRLFCSVSCKGFSTKGQPKKPLTEEHKRKLRNIKVSEETKQKISCQVKKIGKHKNIEIRY